MNRGAVAFKALGVPAKMWAARTGKKVVTVDSWKGGRRTPDAETRDLIHEDWGGPAPELWDELVTELPPRQPHEPVPLETVTPQATESEAANLLQHIRGLQGELTTGGEAFELDKRVRMADQLASAVARLGQISGTRITERAILASPAWLRTEEIILEALRPWPDAARAVADSLDELRGGS